MKMTGSPLEIEKLALYPHLPFNTSELVKTSQVRGDNIGLSPFAKVSLLDSPAIAFKESTWYPLHADKKKWTQEMHKGNISHNNILKEGIE